MPPETVGICNIQMKNMIRNRQKAVSIMTQILLPGLKGKPGRYVSLARDQDIGDVGYGAYKRACKCKRTV